ncbi:MAG TPA: ABC transporter permease [Gemmata sp.]|nr:ABC transporter permease [Gemmata sp.]
MSTFTKPEPSPEAPVPVSTSPASSAETAPSAVVKEGPGTARLIGLVGLFLFILGLVVVLTTRALSPRFLPEWFGYVSGAFGLVFMLYHAASDAEQEIRRMYAGVSIFFLLLAVVVSLLPGPFGSDNPDKVSGYYLLPWGVAAGFLSLLFSIPFTRHETDETYLKAISTGQLGVGGLLAVGSVVAGIFNPDFLVGPGIVLALLGIAFICAYFGSIDTTEGIGYTVAFILGAIGGGIVVYSLARAICPTLLFDGPAVLRNPNGLLSGKAVAFRLLIGVAFLVPFGIAILMKAKLWLKGVLGGIGIVGAGVVAVSLFANPVHTPPMTFLVPGGLILIAIGCIYLAVSMGICSDNIFITLTKREFSAYFFSPIAYLVLAGMAGCEWLGYLSFYDAISAAGMQQMAIPEPIVRYWFIRLIPVFAVILSVPALTMRLFAEEKRTGALEVLLTSPVNEWPIVLSKFFATWMFFLLTWVPAGLFLVALRIETGQAFDYRPLLSFYVALAATGATFVSAGLFFSAITRNQIVAAVLTFALMLVLLFCYEVRDSKQAGATLQAVLLRLSFIHLWIESLNGQLPIKDLLIWISAAVFGLFLSVKVLEIRKWY